MPQLIEEIIECIRSQISAATHRNHTPVLSQPEEMIFFHGYLTSYYLGRMQLSAKYTTIDELNLERDLEHICHSVMPHRLWDCYCRAKCMVSLKHVTTSDVGGINEQGKRAGKQDSNKAPLLAHDLFAYLTAGKG